MTLRIARAVPGSGLALVGFFVPLAVMWAVFYQLSTFTLLTLRLPSGRFPNQGQLFLNLGLFLGFVVVGFAWAFLVARQRVPLGSGSGFGLAGTGLFLRVTSEQILSLDLTHADETTREILLLGRGVGLLVYALGLAMVVAACVAERRLARRALSWTSPSA